MLLIFIIIGAEAVERAGIIARQADVVAGLTLEVLKGTSRAFDSGNVLNLCCRFLTFIDNDTHIIL